MCKVNIDVLEIVRLKQTEVRKSWLESMPVCSNYGNILSIALSVLVTIVLVRFEFSLGERDQLK